MSCNRRGWSHLAGKQLCQKALFGGPARQQVEPESIVCPDSKKDQVHTARVWLAASVVLPLYSHLCSHSQLCPVWGIPGQEQCDILE